MMVCSASLHVPCACTSGPGVSIVLVFYWEQLDTHARRYAKFDQAIAELDQDQISMHAASNSLPHSRLQRSAEL
jgi:hypothetical protein